MARAADPVPRRVALGAGLLYAVFYLWVIGDLDAAGYSAWQFQLGQFDLARVFRARAPFYFEPVAMLQAGHLLWFLSPLNLLITASLAGLLGANVHGVLALRRGGGDQCPIGSRGSVSGALPALLAGGACCAPGLLLLLGIPALGAFAGLFAYLIPLSLILLALSRWWQRRLGAPRLFGPRGKR